MGQADGKTSDLPSILTRTFGDVGQLLAVGETLCEYVVIITAPEICSYAPFDDRLIKAGYGKPEPANEARISIEKSNDEDDSDDVLEDPKVEKIIECSAV